MNRFELHLGDCLETLRTMPDNSVDSIVTDPPYGLSFMGKKWDYDVPSVEIWAECLRVLKPGGHLLAFAGTRTQHRMAVRIEDAGFEIRDMIAWVYGCLDEATEVATENGVMPHHKTKIGDHVLCYDVERGEYTYQPILEIVEYDYSDTAYRLVGDFGEQVVSRNHRVIVEHGGSEAFQLAETLELEARVPVLESLPALRKAVHDAHQGAGRAQQDVQRGLCECADRIGECRGDAAGAAQGRDDQVCCLRGERLEACRVASQGGGADMQQDVQRGTSRRGVGEARSHGSGALVGRVGSGPKGSDDGRVEPGVEGWVDLPESEGCVCRPADQVRALSFADAVDGAGGRLRDGAPTGSGAGDWSGADAGGVRPPHEPRRDGQPTGKPDAVCDERAPQGVRAWRGHRSAVVRVVPFHYTGKVWCLRVPTGAFVAVRNGVAFPTGNSGFPKSLDVSKAIDRSAGAEREVTREWQTKAPEDAGKFDSAPSTARERRDEPATEAARQWQGWGTALKPALEPITVARKPLSEGTVAANVLQHGTGALNIDGCRVGIPEGDKGGWRPNCYGKDYEYDNEGQFLAGVAGSIGKKHAAGRWPANFCHDGSEEVLAGFPQARSAGDYCGKETEPRNSANYMPGQTRPGWGYADSGSAARFFYCAKASKRDRDEGLEGFPTGGSAERDGRNHYKNGSAATNGSGKPLNGDGKTQPRANTHPTVKPTDLMAYLVRLVTPPGGTVLDPFMGSGSTGKAAMREGFRFIGCEMSPEYLEIARARIESAITVL